MKDKHPRQHASDHKAAGPADSAPAPETPPPPAAELEQLKDRLLRLQADFENYRRRTAREQAEYAQHAAEDLLAALLPVVDHFELGLRSAAEHHAESAVMSGFQLVFDQLMEVLKKAGVSAIEAEGQAFDPTLHEAVSHLPSADVPADTVMLQTRRGYRLGSRLLRAAQVVVSSGPPPAPAESGRPDGEPA